MSIFSPKLKRTLWVPLLLGMGALLIWQGVGMASGMTKIVPEQLQNYEFTVWADSSDIGNPARVRMVQLSELEAVRASMLLLQNKVNLIPFPRLEDTEFQLLTVGNRLPYFEEYLNLYAPLSNYHTQFGLRIPSIKGGRNSILIVALNAPNVSEKRISRIVNKLSKKAEVVVVNFDRAAKLKSISDHNTIVQVPSSQSVAQMISAQVLFGGVPVLRSIPDRLSRLLSVRDEFTTDKIRLAYSEPERVGIPADSLNQIDFIVKQAIDSFAFPGCQVLVARKGHVVYHKAFGYHTYRKNRPVRKNDLYDIASVTKVAATTLASMKVYDQGNLQLTAPLNTYFKDGSFVPNRIKVYDSLAIEDFFSMLNDLSEDSSRLEFLLRDTTLVGDSMVVLGKWVRGKGEVQESTPVFDIPVRNLLTHTSGLPSGLPIVYYQRIWRRQLRRPESRYLPPSYNFMDSLWNEVKSLYVDSARYRYSDVNMVLLQRLVDSINQVPLPRFLESEFFNPLGLQHTQFNPADTLPLYRLIPTAREGWRESVVHGYVHDPIATLLGGVSGNAGLFSNANDLCILAQMLLNKGEYGGKRYLADSTINTFTRRQSGHRGFGFDKPPRNTDYLVAESASLSSFGHTGFTGTCLWVDPEEDLIFVFLSNRVHPYANNFTINEMRIRQRIHQVVYKAINKEWRTPARQDRNQQLITLR
ncbi:MAG: serine hydrolase [Bacteroidota bacterium]